MFHRDDNGTHLDIGKDAARTLTPRLPAGTYRFGRTMQGVVFVPQQTAADRYVPVPAPDMDAVRVEFAEFFGAAERERMAHYGVLNKRGVLLWGPHGTGKTRLLLRIVEESAAEHDAVILNGIDPDSDLTQAVQAIRRDDPERSIVVVWDEFDQLIKRFENHLLRWLDGVDSVNNILFVGCTNHIDRIPSRIYARPSRFGLVQYIGPVGDEARAAFITGLYPEIDPAFVGPLVDLTRGQSLDLTKEAATLCVVRGHSPERIAARLKGTRDQLAAVGVTLDFSPADAPQEDDDDDEF